MLKANTRKLKEIKLEYDDFVELFEKASARASEAGGFTGPAEPVTLEDQAASLGGRARSLDSGRAGHPAASRHSQMVAPGARQKSKGRLT